MEGLERRRHGKRLREAVPLERRACDRCSGRRPRNHRDQAECYGGLGHHGRVCVGERRPRRHRGLGPRQQRLPRGTLHRRSDRRLDGGEHQHHGFSQRPGHGQREQGQREVHEGEALLHGRTCCSVMGSCPITQGATRLARGPLCFSKMVKMFI